MRRGRALALLTWRVGRAPVAARCAPGNRGPRADRISLRSASGSGRRTANRRCPGAGSCTCTGERMSGTILSLCPGTLHPLSPGLASCGGGSKGLGHVTVHSAGAPSTLPSSSFGLQDASPLKNMDGLAKLPRRHTASLHAALRRGREARLSCKAQGLLRTPAESTCYKHLAWPSCSHCPRSHPELLARLQAKTLPDRT